MILVSTMPVTDSHRQWPFAEAGTDAPDSISGATASRACRAASWLACFRHTGSFRRDARGRGGGGGSMTNNNSGPDTRQLESTSHHTVYSTQQPSQLPLRGPRRPLALHARVRVQCRLASSPVVLPHNGCLRSSILQIVLGPGQHCNPHRADGTQQPLPAPCSGVPRSHGAAHHRCFAEALCAATRAKCGVHCPPLERHIG
ncbi:hypothetical protein BD413DRAFT_83326 [Trametes elegans]|nr:hypothetical protein BD413DRAFT_83326 [Trametes elegans]